MHFPASWLPLVPRLSRHGADGVQRAKQAHGLCIKCCGVTHCYQSERMACCGFPGVVGEGCEAEMRIFTAEPQTGVLRQKLTTST